MIYRAIGIMSGSSLDGVDLVFVQLESKGKEWQYDIQASTCIPYEENWKERLRKAETCSLRDYLELDRAYGDWLGNLVNGFIEKNQLQYRVQLIAVHGHTVFHHPERGFTHQLGHGAAIAARTGLPVVNDLRAMDIALGGQGAPLVPLGEKLLFPGYDYFLNIGGIANISVHTQQGIIGFDVCAANAILDASARATGLPFDDEGRCARAGSLHSQLLQTLNNLPYYQLPHPKSLSNQFGRDIMLPLVEAVNISVNDALRTYTEHIAVQISKAIESVGEKNSEIQASLFITGGGAFNTFLIERIQHYLPHINLILPDKTIIQFKEALIMALLGVLRWREEPTVIAGVTGATKESIGGAVWAGHL
ncbi:MAG: anhydro-N-acetylmuramic acid kinase [Bacteroidetes bacterium]|nr:anhydro-N-acetylmuramic acid kinase [Bacteroidota bacterium]